MQNVTVGQNVKNIQILPIASRAFLIGQVWNDGAKMEYLEHLDPNLDRIFYFPGESNILLELHANLSNSIIRSISRFDRDFQMFSLTNISAGS